MENILLSGALAFIITFFAIPIIIQVARQKKLFDEPDELVIWARAALAAAHRIAAKRGRTAPKRKSTARRQSGTR